MTIIGHHRRTVDRVMHRFFGQQLKLSPQREHQDIAIFIAEVDFPVGQAGRARNLRHRIVGPIALACADIETVHDAADVRHHEQIALNRHRAQLAVHGFLKIQLAIGIGVESLIVPIRCRIGIRPKRLAGNFIDGSIDTRRDGSAASIDHKLRTDVALLARVNAPEMTGPFAEFRVLAGGNVHSPLINHRRGD